MIDSSAILGEIDLGSSNPCPETDIASSIGTSSVTDTGSMTNTFDKMFSGTSTSKSFGVFDTKQVVKEISPTSPFEEALEVDGFDNDKLTSLSNKTGMTITNDSQLSGATDKVIINIRDTAQSSFSGMSSGSKFSSNAITGLAGGAASRFGGSQLSSIQNYTSDSSIRSVIPGSMTKSDYTNLQSIFGSGSLGQYNSCPSIANALNYAKRLLDPSSLLGSIYSLLGIVGKLDLKGLLNCVGSVQNQLSATQNMGITDMLVSKGSLNGLNDLTSLGNNGSIVNKYDTVRRLSNNRSVSTSPYTYRPTNTWTNPDTISTSNSLFTTLGIDSSKIFTMDTVSPTKNSSIMNGLSSPVYSVAEINKVNPDTGFSSFILGSKDKLLRNLPTFTA